MTAKRIDSEFSQLVGLIYQGALEEQPWQSALPALREALDAQVVSLILRPPTADDLELLQVIDEPEQVVDAIFKHYEGRGFEPLPQEHELLLNL